MKVNFIGSDSDPGYFSRVGSETGFLLGDRIRAIFSQICNPLLTTRKVKNKFCLKEECLRLTNIKQKKKTELLSQGVREFESERKSD